MYIHVLLNSYSSLCFIQAFGVFALVSYGMLAGLWFALYIFKSQSSNTSSKINGEEHAEPI